MKLQALTDYSNKQLHGLRWGLNVFRGPGYRIGLRELGGDCERLENQDISRLQSTDRVLMMGNAWIHRDPRDRRWWPPEEVRGRVREFYFWDNPPLPHILYQGRHNPLSRKNWMRITPGSIMPRDLGWHQRHVDRINEQLRDCTDGWIQHWQQLTGGTEPVQPRGRRVLVIMSSSQVYERYAGVTKQQWLNQVRAECERQHLYVEIRDKQSRGRRRNCEIDQHLRQGQYRATISFQSMAQVESIIAGVPAVNYLGTPVGIRPVTPWQEFQSGILRMATQDQVEHEVETLFSQMFHKTEAYSGGWYDEQTVAVAPGGPTLPAIPVADLSESST